MVEYMCEICGKLFKKKSNYIDHMNRKIKCTKNCIDEKNNSNFTCKFCDKNFIRKYNYDKHSKNCKMNNNLNLEKLYQDLLLQMKKQNEKIEMLENQNKKIEVLEKENEKIKKELMMKNIKINNLNNLNNSNNTNINSNNKTQNNYINIVAFGKEDISFITKQDWIKLLNMKYMSVKGLIEKIHFNENQIQNANVYISNLKDNYAMYYNGMKWIIESKNDIITNLIDSKTDHLESKFYEIINDLPKLTKEKFTEFLENNDSDNYLNKIKEEIKLMLYNKKDIPMKIIKDNEKALIYN
jgi:hypothetical protein